MRKTVNMREGKDGKILVSYPDAGKIRVTRFWLGKFNAFGNPDAVFSDAEDLVGRRQSGVEEIINEIRLRRKYPNMDYEGVKKLELYLCAREYAAEMARKNYSELIDRTSMLRRVA